MLSQLKQVLTAALFVLPIAAAAQVNPPQYAQGDTWTYRELNGYNNVQRAVIVRSISGTAGDETRVTTSLPDGRVVREDRYAGGALRDGTLNDRAAGALTPPLDLRPYPLNEGQRWSQRVTRSDRTSTAPSAACMNDKVRVRAAIATMTLLWGTTWGAIRIGLDGMPPLTGISLRFSLAGLLLMPLAARLGQRYPRDRAFWALCLANGLLLFTASYSIVYWCEQWVPSGLGAVIFATYPLLVMLFAHLVLPAERISRRGVLAGLIGFLGIAVVFSEDLRGLLGLRAATGAVILLLSPLVSALAAVAVRLKPATSNASNLPFISASFPMSGRLPARQRRTPQIPSLVDLDREKRGRTKAVPSPAR